MGLVPLRLDLSYLYGDITHSNLIIRKCLILISLWRYYNPSALSLEVLTLDVKRLFHIRLTYRRSGGLKESNQPICAEDPRKQFT